ncbi:MAG TPA: acyl-CoA carboxylase subunit epsilon [Streptosporangiaceae bacterium]|nr:acyl-CoA carboxylase subunit epsilon [Streptosporangiaceae bacterium]
MTGDGPDGRDGPPASGLALEVVAGHPSPAELAALTVALSAALAARGAPARAGLPGRASPGWADRSRMMGAPLTPGRDAWRRSAQPGTPSHYRSGLLPR